MLLMIALIWLYQFAFESRYKEFLQTGVVRVGPGRDHDCLPLHVCN
jgi:hypothetical protein